MFRCSSKVFVWSNLNQRFTMWLVETATTCKRKWSATNFPVYTNDVHCFHSNNYLLQCFFQLNVAQLHAALTGTVCQSSIIKISQTFTVYSVNSGKCALSSLLFPMEDIAFYPLESSHFSWRIHHEHHIIVVFRNSEEGYSIDWFPLKTT